MFIHNYFNAKASTALKIQLVIRNSYFRLGEATVIIIIVSYELCELRVGGKTVRSRSTLSRISPIVMTDRLY